MGLTATPIGPVIITPMASDPFLSWTNRTVLRPDREEPYLCIQDIVVFVRDLDVSKRFYVDQLGFELITDKCLPSGASAGLKLRLPTAAPILRWLSPSPTGPNTN